MTNNERSETTLDYIAGKTTPGSPPPVREYPINQKIERNVRTTRCSLVTTIRRTLHLNYNSI